MPEDDGGPDIVAVKRGDLYVPLATRFLVLEDKVGRMERKVTVLTWVVIIDVIISLAGVNNNPVLLDFLKAILAK